MAPTISFIVHSSISGNCGLVNILSPVGASYVRKPQIKSLYSLRGGSTKRAATFALLRYQKRKGPRVAGLIIRRIARLLLATAAESTGPTQASGAFLAREQLHRPQPAHQTPKEWARPQCSEPQQHSKKSIAGAAPAVAKPRALRPAVKTHRFRVPARLTRCQNGGVTSAPHRGKKATRRSL